MTTLDILQLKVSDEPSHNLEGDLFIYLNSDHSLFCFAILINLLTFISKNSKFQKFQRVETRLKV